MLNKLRSNQGFTLIELLIVVAIIGILAAIAIPQFSAYQKRGYASAVRSDVNNVNTAVKAYISDTQANPIGAGPTSGPGQMGAPYSTARVSKNVSVTVVAGDPDTYTITGSHVNLASVSYTVTGAGGLTDNLSSAWQ